MSSSRGLELVAGAPLAPSPRAPSSANASRAARASAVGPVRPAERLAAPPPARAGRRPPRRAPSTRRRGRPRPRRHAARRRGRPAAARTSARTGGARPRMYGVAEPLGLALEFGRRRARAVGVARGGAGAGEELERGEAVEHARVAEAAQHPLGRVGRRRSRRRPRGRARRSPSDRLRQRQRLLEERTRLVERRPADPQLTEAYGARRGEPRPRGPQVLQRADQLLLGRGPVALVASTSP